MINMLNYAKNILEVTSVESSLILFVSLKIFLAEFTEGKLSMFIQNTTENYSFTGN